MTDPIRVPLSLFQQQRFHAMRAEAQRLADRQNEAVTTIIAAEHDPATLVADQWSFRLDETEIVCIPPLVPDIGPASVRDAAATG